MEGLSLNLDTLKKVYMQNRYNKEDKSKINEVSSVSTASSFSFDTQPGNGQLGFSSCSALSGHVTGEFDALLQISNKHFLFCL